MISQEQQNLIEAIEAVHMACTLTGASKKDISTVFHHQACNNSPGWNVFLQNIRFELGYEHNKIRFSIPPDEDKIDPFCSFVKNELGFNDINYTHRPGIKYVFIVNLDEHIYSEDGIDKIAKLTNTILDFEKF